MHVLDLWTEFQNTEVSVTLLKSYSTTEALPAILKNLGTIKGRILDAKMKFWKSSNRFE